MPGVVVPLHPGVYSAMGLLMSDVKHDYIRSKLSVLSATSERDVDALFAEMEAVALKDLHQEDFPDDRIALERTLDLRYAGQGYEVTLPCDLRDGGLAGLRTRFDQSHQRNFGHMAPDEPVEIVSYRLRGIGRVPLVTLKSYQPQGTALKDALRETRPVRFDGATLDCPVYQRERLDVGTDFAGPAIIDQLDCTTIIPPGHHARVDDHKHIIVTAGDR